MAKKAKRSGQATPKPKSAKQPAKKARPGVGPKSGKSTKKAAAPKAAGAGHDFSGAVRMIVQKAASPLTLAQIREEHSLRFSDESPTSVDRAVVSLVKSSDLSVAPPPPSAEAMDSGPGDEASAAVGVVVDDPWPLILDLLCRRHRGEAFDNFAIRDRLKTEYKKVYRQGTVDDDLFAMETSKVICKTDDGKKYKCCGT